MGNSGSSHVQGLRELEQALLGLGRETSGKLLYSALRAAAKPIEMEAESRAPVSERPHYRYKRQKVKKIKRTGNRVVDRYNRLQARSEARKAPAERVLVQPGNLRKSISVRAMKGRKYLDLTEKNAAVGISWTGDAFYGRFMELGTSKTRPESFLRAAFDARKDEAVEIFKVKLAAGIERARRRLAAEQGLS